VRLTGEDAEHAVDDPTRNLAAGRNTSSPVAGRSPRNDSLTIDT
jgi:hypothetical protein